MRIYRKQFTNSFARRFSEYFTVGLLAAMALATPRLARGSQIFAVNLAVGSGSVTGTITTDGTLGTIAESDIVGLDLRISAPFGSAVATKLSNFFTMVPRHGAWAGAVIFEECAVLVTQVLHLVSRTTAVCFPFNYTELTGNVTIGTATPEPNTVLLFAAGLVGLGVLRTRRAGSIR